MIFYIILSQEAESCEFTGDKKLEIAK